MAKTLGFFDDETINGLKMNRGYNVPKMRILVACEFSGIVRDAFLAKGHDAMSCDLLETERPGPHYKGDVRDVIKDGWDMLLGFPTGTYLSNSGVPLFHKEGKFELFKDKIEDALDLFLTLWNSGIPKICIENPIMCTYAKKRVGRQQSQIIHPWMFGHLEQQAMCLWLNNLHKITPTKNVYAEMMKLPEKERQPRIHISTYPDRWKDRCRTYEGIAAGMAEQWG